MWRRRVAIVLTWLVAAVPGAARDLLTGPQRSLTLRTSLKASLLLAHAPDDPELFPEPDSAASFWRLRLEPEARLGERVSLGLAYEQRVRVFSQGGDRGGSGILPAESAAPYRLRQLDAEVASASGYAWRHELDRGFIALHLPRAEITIGRQAIGWGRGVLFGAVDLFAPFTPLEADREWRRGVDAVRADLKLGSRVSLDLVGAFGRNLDASAFAGRLRGYAGKLDLELVAGRRARDVFAGVTSSAAVGDAEIHGELAVFHAPEPLPGVGTDVGRRAVKAVLGGSRRFAMGNGLLVFLEYHYSGFGAERAQDIPTLLADPAFLERYQRGDTQILGRHALALMANYEVSPELALAAQWLQSPRDGSGLVAPSATFTFGDTVSAVATAYLPWGRTPHGTELRSEYGATARAAFLQIRVYD